MKESITKFDLEAAFKALDEIEPPKAKKGIRANKPALTEIFSRKSKFDALMEEYYDIGNTAELADAKEAREAEIAKAKLARIEKIVDLDAESPEDLLTSYVGKFIIQCPQCMTLFYKNPEDVEESEDDSTVVNVNEVCQHCGNESGYTLIGKVGEAEPEDTAEIPEVSEEEDAPEEAPEEDSETSEDPTEDEFEDFDLGDELDELDLEIEDDETEEKKEEALFQEHSDTTLVEQLTEEADDFDVSASEFAELINSPEFKKPISDTATRAMLDAMEESEPSKDVEEELKTTEKASSEQLEEGILDKLKDKFVNTIDKVASSLKSREAKADWILKNAMEDYDNVQVDNKGVLVPDEKNKRFNVFIVIGYKDKYSNGKPITMAPSFSNRDLVIGMRRAEVKNNYKDADSIAKGWSMRQGNGPAFIYLAKSEDDNKAVFLCEYFQGELEYDQLEKYFNVVKKDLEACKLMAKGGMGQNAEEGTKQEASLSLENVKSKDLKFFATEIFNHFNKEYSIDVVDGYKIHIANIKTDLTDELNKVDVIVKNNIETKTEKLADGTYAYMLKHKVEDANEDLSTIMNGLEELQESSLEKFISDSLVEAYGNVAGFRLAECTYLNEVFRVNGTIYFTSGNTRKTTYTFSEASTDQNGKTKLCGLNEKLGLDKQFIITGYTDKASKTFITESFTYSKN